MSAPLRVVLVGHVDHGKSTLAGRLAYESGALPEGRHEQAREAAGRRGAAFEWAALTDALQAERDRNVTIDATQLTAPIDGRAYVLIDAPGHQEFLKNMITGAAAADAAIITIDASRGVEEQSRRHGVLLRLLGLSQVGVVVNKMDLAGYSESRFREVAAAFDSFLARIGVRARAIVPASAAHGDNVTGPSARLPWHDGPTVSGLLRMFSACATPDAQPLRLPLQAVYRFDGRAVFAGRVESGRLRVGDPVLFLPAGDRRTIASVERWAAGTEHAAGPGESIGFTVDPPVAADRGDVLTSATHPAPVRSTFRARVFWLGQEPLVAGRRYTFRLTTQEFHGTIEVIHDVTDSSTLAALDASAGVGAHAVADVTIRAASPVVLDRFSDLPKTGRFVIVDARTVRGGGIVVDMDADDPASAAPHLTGSTSQIQSADRSRMNRHRGLVVWMTGLSGSGKSTLARAAERALFDAGRQVFVLDGDNFRHGLSVDLGFSDADRSENIRRAAETARLFAEAGLIVMAAFISPSRRQRAAARRIVTRGDNGLPFVEVFIDAPLDVCESRDPKQLYARARQGLIPNFTGVSAPFERPDAPDLAVKTHEMPLAASVNMLIAAIEPLIAV